MVHSLRQISFVLALAVVSTLGFMSVTTTPAQALNCSLYERPGCAWVGYIDTCCYFVGPGCGPHGERVGPCFQGGF